MQKSCKSKKLTAENRKMFEFQMVVLNKQIVRPQVLRQYSAISWPFFGRFYTPSEKFDAGLMHPCVSGKEASMKEKLNIVSIHK
jgi:hypothetical protein